MSKPLHGKFPLSVIEAGKHHISYAGFADPEKSHLTKFCDALGEFLHPSFILGESKDSELIKVSND